MSTRHRASNQAVIVIVTLTCLLALAGCGPTVLPPTQHPPISAGAVNLYQKAPERYEVLSVMSVPVTPEMKWNEKGDSPAAFEALKTRAAAQGANGVLLTAQPGSFDVMAIAGYHGTWYQVPVKREPKTLVAQAIFVPGE